MTAQTSGGQGLRVLEIAANDGSWFRVLLDRGTAAIGIDSAANPAAQARGAAILMLTGSWLDGASCVEDPEQVAEASVPGALQAWE